MYVVYSFSIEHSRTPAQFHSICINPLSSNFNYRSFDGNDEIINSNLTAPHE